MRVNTYEQNLFHQSRDLSGVALQRKSFDITSEHASADTMAKSHVKDMSIQLNHLIQSMYGSFKLQTIFAACELGIFDELSLGKATANDLSGKLSTNETATTQLLDTLVSLELLEKHCKEEPPCYSNTQIAEMSLVKSSPDSIRGLIKHFNTITSKLFDNLAWAVGEGTSQWQRAFGRSQSEFFKSIYATKEEKINFLDTMKASCKPDASRLVCAFDLHEFNRMCDLGGKC